MWSLSQEGTYESKVNSILLFSAQNGKERKEVRKIREKVTYTWITITSVFAFILLVLCSIGLLNKEAKYYLIGVLFGFIGLIVRSVSMLNHIDKQEYIDKNGNIKYRWYDINGQSEIIKSAYFFKYPVFITLTILALISLATPFLDKLAISLILIASISMLVGFILKSPKYLPLVD